MGLRDFLKQKREEHGGLRRFAKSIVAGAPSERPAQATPPGRSTPSRAEVTLPTAPDAEGYLAVAASADVADGQGQTVAVQGEPVAIFRVGDALYAIDNTCVHEDGPLGEGHVEGGVVVCPYHDWRYELSSGKCLSEPGRAVGCFAIRERDGFVWVGKRRSASSSDRGGAHDDGMQVLVREV